MLGPPFFYFDGNTKKGLTMDGARPIYMKLLIVALVIYIIGVTAMQADMYIKIIRIEHIVYDHLVRK